MAEVTTGIRKTRSKKVTEEPTTAEITATALPSVKKPSPDAEPFKELNRVISQAQEDFEKLRKEITETKEAWIKEQQEHERLVRERGQEEDLARKREQETYLYNTDRQRKQAEDEFSDKKSAWDKQLRDQNEALEKDQTELAALRKQVASFDTEKEKTVREAQVVLEKELTAKFGTEQKLKDQEAKAEKDILNLKISNLISENTRQTNEIEALKKALEEATRQVKDIAVKVIESNSPNKTSVLPEPLKS